MEAIINSYYENDAKKLRMEVDKVLKHLKFVDVIKEEYYSLANLVFADIVAKNRYNGKQDFNGFLFKCLENYFKNEMTASLRDKRIVLKHTVSIDTPLRDDVEDNAKTLGDLFEAKENVENEIFYSEEEWSNETLMFLNTLSPLQRSIAMLLSDGMDRDSVCLELGIDKKQYDNSITRMSEGCGACTLLRTSKMLRR